jgi:hypothetical protein
MKLPEEPALFHQLPTGSAEDRLRKGSTVPVFNKYFFALIASKNDLRFPDPGMMSIHPSFVLTWGKLPKHDFPCWF